MNNCCQKWISEDIIRISGKDMGSIEHLFSFCPECSGYLDKKKDEVVQKEFEIKVNSLRYCDWISDELFFKIRSFLLVAFKE